MDYIYITDENNNRIKMELVTTFELKNRDYKYNLRNPCNY